MQKLYFCMLAFDRKGITDKTAKLPRGSDAKPGVSN